MSTESVRYCPECARDSAVEAPPCADGHGADCPERICVTCGTALLLDPELVGTGTPAPARRAA
jgi:hypothetical protein